MVTVKDLFDCNYEFDSDKDKKMISDQLQVFKGKLDVTLRLRNTVRYMSIFEAGTAIWLGLVIHDHPGVLYVEIPLETSHDALFFLDQPTTSTMGNIKDKWTKEDLKRRMTPKIVAKMIELDI